MWSRARLDIGWQDLAAGLLAAIGTSGPSPKRVAARWDPAGLVFFTVRTAWDALLAELELPPGEVVVSAINIPDMFDLLEHHGLRPVPVDVDPATLAPVPGALAAAIGERTRLVLLTHLLGSRIDMDVVYAELDRAGAKLPVVEDCAQAFRGLDFRGHPRSLAALFSFGPIKSSSALGGCMAQIPDPELRRNLLGRVQQYPRQRRSDYVKLVARYSALKALATPTAYAAFVRACQLSGRSHDEVINAAVLGLKGDDYWAALRRRPAAPLLAVLDRRLAGFDDQRIERRRQHGEWLAKRLRDEVQVLGSAASNRSWWQFAVISSDPNRLIQRLREAGFDATAGSSRLRCSTPPLDAADPTPRARAAMAAIVYVPAYAELSADELARLADVIARVEAT